MFRTMYDTDVTVWSPQGRLLQVEYAMEAVKQGSACLGIVGSKYVVLAALKRSPHDLAAYQKKLLKIDDHVGVAIAGLNADARTLAKYMRTECLNHKYVFGAPLQASRLLSDVADKHQRCTQTYVRRPYGVGLLVASFDATGHTYRHADGNGTSTRDGDRHARESAKNTREAPRRVPGARARRADQARAKALAGCVPSEKELDKQCASVAVVGEGVPRRMLDGDDVQPYLDQIELEGGAPTPEAETKAEGGEPASDPMST